MRRLLLALLVLLAGLPSTGLALVGSDTADAQQARDLRKQEKRLATLERRYAKELDQCQNGNRRACDLASDAYAEMQQIIPTIPAKPKPD